jgi:hypothetical protein
VSPIHHVHGRVDVAFEVNAGRSALVCLLWLLSSSLLNKQIYRMVLVYIIRLACMLGIFW